MAMYKLYRSTIRQFEKMCLTMSRSGARCATIAESLNCSQRTIRNAISRARLREIPRGLYDSGPNLILHFPVKPFVPNVTWIPQVSQYQIENHKLTVVRPCDESETVRRKRLKNLKVRKSCVKIRETI